MTVRQIVIDIDEDVIIAISRMGLFRIPDRMLVKVDKALQQGKPLPKGHGRLIDADEAIQRLCGKSCGCTLEECGYEVPCFSVQRINSARVVLEAENESLRDEIAIRDMISQHLNTGHWIEHQNNGMTYIECSECSSWFLRMYLTRNSYCPNCGKRMTESEG